MFWRGQIQRGLDACFGRERVMRRKLAKHSPGEKRRDHLGRREREADTGEGKADGGVPSGPEAGAAGGLGVGACGGDPCGRGG